MKAFLSQSRCPALLVTAALLAATPAGAETLQKAQATVDQRLQQSLQELASVRDRIAKEKIPLSKAISDLEDQVLALREKRARQVEVGDSRTIDLSSLHKQVDLLKEQQEFVDGRLNEFISDFEGRLDISELPHYEKLTSAAELSGKNANLDAAGKRDAQIAVVKAALARLRAQLGGQVFEGQALGPDGALTQGHFVAIGPSVFYASNDGKVSGIVENQLNTADPVVVALPGGLASGIATVASTGKGRLPFDATLGNALKIEKARETLAQHLEKGGFIGYFILVLGAAALLLAVVKVREILGFRVAEPDRVDEILDDLAAGNTEEAAQRAKRVSGVSGEMLSTGVEHAHARREILEELLFEKILRVRPVLERYLPVLAITAAAAPLLGLLGTVTGMIKTFQLLTIFGTGDAKSLSSGISEALVTTELGLMVAIPALILHGALSRMAKHKLGLLEQLSVALVNGLTSMRVKPLVPAPRAVGDE